jgi:hypothetical protein
VKIPADLSHSGEAYWKDAEIDACIADIVEALQQAGIDMRTSCCGHGGWGEIVLQDGRVLMIQPYPPPEDEFSPELREMLKDVLRQRRT